jgi:endonuclease/exonuclease/phosphatase family metal-dependent hydrolase
MRLVTVNLYNGRVVPSDLLRFLEAVRPDIVCAQEVGPDAARILDRRFPYGAVEGGLDHEGRALVGLQPMGVTLLALPFRGGLVGRVEMAGRPLEVISIHLANPIDGFRGIPARRAQLEALEPVLSRRADRLVVGDMNATPSWPTYRRLSRHLDDGVRQWAERTGNRAAPTWAKAPGWPAVLRIDHVFTSGVELTNVTVQQIAGLDHKAVTVDVAWPGGTSP